MERELHIPNTKQIPPLYKFTAKAYLWMFIGLVCTAVTAFYMVASGLVTAIVFNSAVPMILIGAKIALVVFLSARLHKLSVGASKAIFIAYSFLTGITFSTIGYIYDLNTIFIAFAFTAVLFACLAIIGFTTKKDMASFGPLLLGGLVALFVVHIIGIFINLAAFDLFIGLAGVILFLGVTIYDTQKMKNAYNMAQNDHMMLEKLSIFFALELYLDFINIFIYLLRIMGRKK